VGTTREVKLNGVGLLVLLVLLREKEGKLKSRRENRNETIFRGGRLGCTAGHVRIDKKKRTRSRRVKKLRVYGK